MRKIVDRLLPKAPGKVANPEKELRFTRARQALTFVAIGTAFVGLAIGVLIKATPMLGNAAGEAPVVTSPWWAALPMLPALWCFWVAAHCARHAFVILTPLGIELFPFLFPTKNMRALYWSEITAAAVGDDLRNLIIELDGGGKVFVALAPIAKSARPLLQRAIDGRAGASMNNEQ